MTFDKDYLSRISSSGSENAPVWRSYASSTDTLATIIAAGYFNDKILDWAVNDVIGVQGTDGYGLYKVTSVTTNVTVEAYDIPEGSLDLTDGHFFVGDATNKAADVAMSGDATLANTGVVTIAAGAVSQAKIAANSLDATVAKNVADLNGIGGIPILFRADTTGGASETIDLTMTHKIQVLDFWVVHKAAGTASDTIKLVNNGGNDITNALDISGADKTIVRVGTLDDAETIVAATAELQIVETDGGGSDSPPVSAYILAIRVA